MNLTEYLKMKIVSYEPGLAPGICELYNLAVEPVVHCNPVDPSRVRETLQGALETNTRGPGNLGEECCFAGVHGSTLVGFIHAGVLVNQEERPENGAIRFLAYRAGSRSVGLSLLDRGEAWLKDSGAASVVAFHQDYRLPFYHYGPAYLSDRIGHVQALLVSRGYEKCGGEVFLDCASLKPRIPDPIDLTVEVTSEQKPGRGKLPGLRNLAWIDGKEAGECLLISSVEDQKTEAVEDRGFVEWLGVAEPLQGQGVGKYLLQRTLNDAYALGYRRAGISTAWDNHKAFVFYSNFGFSVSDWTYGWMKEI